MEKEELHLKVESEVEKTDKAEEKMKMELELKNKATLKDESKHNNGKEKLEQKGSNKKKETRRRVMIEIWSICNEEGRR